MILRKDCCEGGGMYHAQRCHQFLTLPGHRKAGHPQRKTYWSCGLADDVGKGERAVLGRRPERAKVTEDITRHGISPELQGLPYGQRISYKV